MEKQREIEEYIENRNTITDLEGEMDARKDIALRLSFEISKELDGEIRKLEDKKRETISQINMEAATKTKEIESRIKPLAEKALIMARRLEFLRHKEEVEKGAILKEEGLATPGRGHEVIRYGPFYSDQYTEIVLFIVENRKPKNKYSIVAVGATSLIRFLNENAIYHYGAPIGGRENNILISVADVPSIEDAKALIERRGKNLLPFMRLYEQVKAEYLDTIHNYSIDDFKLTLEPRKIAEENAPLVCRITEYGKTRELRLHRKFYYSNVHQRKDPFDLIEVNNVVYGRVCRMERLAITQNGNTLFGDWWSMRVEPSINGKLFNDKNWKEVREETDRWIAELDAERTDGKKISYDPPEVEWIHPELTHFDYP